MAKRDSHPTSQSDLFGGPDMSLEDSFRAQGKIVCGVDEAGRGPLAGPVVTAAVILNPANVPDGLNDSKKLTEKARDRLYDVRFQSGAFVSIAVLIHRCGLDHRQGYAGSCLRDHGAGSAAIRFFEA